MKILSINPTVSYTRSKITSRKKSMSYTHNTMPIFTNAYKEIPAGLPLDDPRITSGYYYQILDRERILYIPPCFPVVENKGILYLDKTKGNQKGYFEGVHVEKKDGITKVTHYIKGSRSMASKYIDGICCESWVYNFETKKAVEVKKGDDFILSQNYNKYEKSIDVTLNTKNKEGKAIKVCVSAPFNPLGRSVCTCDILGQNYLGNVSLRWCQSPDENTTVFSEQARELLRESLVILKDTLQQDEYREDFGNNVILNSKIDQAINYLDNASQQ